MLLDVLTMRFPFFLFPQVSYEVKEKEHVALLYM